jgi:hypothetical protein
MFAAAIQVLPVAHSDASTTLLVRGTDGSVWQLAWPHMTASATSARGSTTATLHQLAQASNVSSDVSNDGESQFISGSYPSDIGTIGSQTIGSELLLNTDAARYLLQSTQAATVTTATTANSTRSSSSVGAVYGWQRPAEAVISSSSGSSGSVAAVVPPLRTATGLCVRVVTTAAVQSADSVAEQQHQVLEVTALQQDATDSSKHSSSCVWRHVPIPAADGEVCINTIESM